jgi:hypothetical protein
MRSLDHVLASGGRRLTPGEFHALMGGRTPGIYAMAGGIVTMDVFNQDAFSAVNLTAAIDHEGFVPQLLGDETVIPDLFVPPPLGQPHSEVFFVEERTNEPALIQTSPRGSFPDDGRSDEKSRDARPFTTKRLFRKRRIVPRQLAGIRQFGSITELQSLETMVQRLQYLMQKDMSLTFEHQRLGAVQGLVLDANGSTIFDWAKEFNQKIPAAVTWTLPNTAATNDGTISGLVSTACRTITRALKGQGGTGVTFHGICGDSFYDKLRGSAEVRETFKYQQGELLRAPRAWRQLEYGGATFYNYRGTDDQSTVAVDAKTCAMFPAGAGIFQKVFSPADERFEFLDTPGQEAYSWVVVDPLRNAWADVEMASYPAFMCTMPSALYTAKIS